MSVMGEIFQTSFTVQNFRATAHIFFHVQCKTDNTEIQPLFVCL